MNKSCVIFSCTILSEERLFVLRSFLEEFKKDFMDSDLYIGINYNSVQPTEDIIESYELNVKKMGRASEELYSYSDASGYQLALKYAKDSNVSYDTYWFVHTKSGVNSHSDYLKDWYINNFLSNRINVEKFLSDHTNIGSYGMLSLAYDEFRSYQEQDTEISLFENVLTDTLPYTHANFFYIHTIYAIKGVVVDKFFKLITDTWYSSKLDRYYFEGVFPFIVSRLGYFPYVSNGMDLSGKSVVELNVDWINKNKLLSHNEYINLHKTNYIFNNQLLPPNNYTPC